MDASLYLPTNWRDLCRQSEARKVMAYKHTPWVATNQAFDCPLYRNLHRGPDRSIPIFVTPLVTCNSPFWWPEHLMYLSVNIRACHLKICRKNVWSLCKYLSIISNTCRKNGNKRHTMIFWHVLEFKLKKNPNRWI